MSTHANIRIKRTDGTTAGIYLHYDGYIDGAGVTLQMNYSTAEKVEELIALGGISMLGNTTEECVAYHRDRGEQLWQTVQDEEFIYTYDASLCYWTVTCYEYDKSSAASELCLDGIYQREYLLIDKIKNYGAEVYEACKQKAVEARQPAIDAYLEWQEIYTR